MMSDWPPVQSTKPKQEKDSIYLKLVDMFVEVVEPSIIQMVLQNRNWDLDAAIDDIMVLSNTTFEKPSNISSTVTFGNNKRVSNSSNTVHYNGFDSFEEKRNAAKDDDSRRVTSSKILEKSNKASVREEYHAEKKNSSDFNQSLFSGFSDKNKTSEVDLSEFVDGYNYVKALPTPYERGVLLVRNGVRLMIILRGPPGSGKSYLANKLLSEAGIDQSRHKKHVFSSDDYFMQNNVYVFDPTFLSQAHMFNQHNVLTAIKKYVSPIIVDNTNTQAWEMRAYADMAVSNGYDLEIVEPGNWWLFRESELFKRNVHGVPKAKIRNMIERYEKHITPRKIMQQFELQYSLNNAPPQPVLNAKWKDKLRSFKSNKPKKKKQEMFSKQQTHSSKGKLKNIMPTMSLEHHEFLDGTNLHSTLPCPNLSLPSGSTYNFEYVNNSMVPQNINEAHISSDFHCSKNMFYDKENKSISPNRSNIPVNSIENLIQAYTPSISGGAQNTSSPSNMEVDESSNGSLGFQIHKEVSFDKTISTNRVMVLDNFIHIKNETLPLDFGSDINIGSGKVLPPAEETKGDEKELFAKKLINSIIDSVDSLNTADAKNDISHNKAHEMGYQADGMNHMDGLSDYVLVSSNNTFIYKNLNSVPISFSTLDKNSAFSQQTSKQLTDAHLLNQICDGFCKTDSLKSETNIWNENVNIHEDERVAQSNFDTRNEPTTLLMSSLDSIFKEINVPNIDSCKNISSQLVENINKNIKFKVAKENKECQEQTHEKKEDVQAILENKDTSVVEYSTEKHCEKKTNAMGIMDTILSSIFPSSEEPSNLLSNDTEVDRKEYDGAHIFVNCSPSDDWIKTSTDETINILEKDNPKPARKLARSKVSANNDKPISYKQNSDNFNFGTWNTVNNAAEHWESGESQISYELPKKGLDCLPQRLKLNKYFIDSSTNTSYHDFLAVSQHSLPEVKVLIGNKREISTGCHKNTIGISQTLLLDKSTMTYDNTSRPVKKLDLSQINILFPHIPESYILDMVEKCQGDIDWAVDLLLDSEHSMYGSNDGSKESPGASSCIDHNISENYTVKVNDAFQKIQRPKFVCTTPNTSNEIFELKKAIESSVVLNKAHYSDQVLKVLKKKNPEYLHLIEGQRGQNEECLSNSELSTMVHESILEETNSSDEEKCNNYPVERHEDDDTLELIVSYDLVLQLQQKFGNSSTPKIMNMTPLVKLPVSLARQLYGYMMDSIQKEVDEQQEEIENMIAKDEEIAIMLHHQDHNLKPKLQEIMDMEVALAVHKADQEEWNERSNNTVAAKLSQNILLEKFPHVDPKMLIDMLHAHNYSLHDTVNSLKLALEVGDNMPELTESNTAAFVSRLDENKDTGSICTLANESVDPLNEAQSHRQEAATYYSMRIECLRKANEAYRSGNKPVASYYSQLAQLHKQKVEQCNSAAASCLLSSHKAGNTLDLHFLHITEAEVVLDMFLDEIINYISDRRKRYQTVFLITGRGLRSVGGVSRIKPMAIKKLQSRKVLYNEVNPGMLSALVRIDTPLSYTA